MNATARFMLAGFCGALFLNFPFYSYALEKDILWTFGFLPIWINNTLGAFMTFFHELGHTIAGWFYGIPTIPMFDFTHGGGWAWQVTGQVFPLVLFVWGGLAYLWYLARDYKFLQIIISILLVFNIFTALNPWHLAVISFMGPASECLCGGFFLIRALYNLSPRGSAERFMNALLGFAFPIHSIIDGYSLLHFPAARERYFAQKDGQGAGDFDQIPDKLDFASFEGAVTLWMVLAALCLILPIVLYFIAPPYEEEKI